MAFLDRYRDPVYALTRMVIGFLFAMHGVQKIFGLFGGAPAEMPTALLYLVGGIELVGGGLVCVGSFARQAAFICSGTMAVAYFGVHQATGLLPIQNHGEPAAMYCWIFLLIATVGNGIWSVGGSARASA